ncbi:hypothetical protein AB595_00960 [Massilia sp. WF1]|nr:hypothetical protein AM586_25100 [Massilia sp. WG5]KLU38467.1 hypothetical protein AB595_00960 [Massilia sp. WF1]
MFKGLDGALYYQCAPTGDDRTEFMFRILRDRNRLADLESISHDRRNQIAMIDSMMHVSEDAEDNFISEMWTAVDAAMRSGLLLGLELAGCHPTVSLDLF